MFLDRAHGRVHGAIFSKFLNAFFAILPESNPLYLRSNKSKNEKIEFACITDRDPPFYNNA